MTHTCTSTNKHIDINTHTHVHATKTITQTQTYTRIHTIHMLINRFTKLILLPGLLGKNISLTYLISSLISLPSKNVVIKSHVDQSY